MKRTVRTKPLKNLLNKPWKIEKDLSVNSVLTKLTVIFVLEFVLFHDKSYMNFILIKQDFTIIKIPSLSFVLIRFSSNHPEKRTYLDSVVYVVGTCTPCNSDSTSKRTYYMSYTNKKMTRTRWLFVNYWCESYNLPHSKKKE